MQQIKTCKHCGKPFGPGRHPENFGRAKMCSRACWHAAKKFTPEKAAAAFWGRVRKTDGCWMWTGAKHVRGYGACAPVYGDTRAHRVSWQLTNGTIPSGRGVLHTCDNMLCVNPQHLYLGTQKENIADCIARGRRNNRYTPVEKLLHPHLSARLK